MITEKDALGIAVEILREKHKLNQEMTDEQVVANYGQFVEGFMQARLQFLEGISGGIFTPGGAPRVEKMLIIAITEDEDDGEINIQGANRNLLDSEKEGFNVFESLGLLEKAKENLLRKMDGNPIEQLLTKLTNR